MTTDDTGATHNVPGRPWWRQSRTRWCIRAAVILIAFGALRIVTLDSKFYYPNDVTYDHPRDFGLAAQDVTFQTSDGLMLHGWLLTAQRTARTSSQPAAAKGTVIHFHGNAANITAHIGLIAWLPPLGYNVLMFDYRGYGRSQGRINRHGTIRDGNAAVDYVLSRPDLKDLPVYAYGQSLGGAVATVVAADRPEIRAVVAESPFSSYRRIAGLHARKLVYFHWLGDAVAGWAISDGHDPIDIVGNLSPRPIFVIAAENDRICFPELARELYDAAAEPKSWWLVPHVEHLEIPLSHNHELGQRVDEFFDSAPALAPSSSPSRASHGAG